MRLPLAFSERLWGVTHVGTPIIIAGAHSDPWELIHPGLVLGTQAEHEFAQAVGALDGKHHPADWGGGAGYLVSAVIASTADRRVELLEDGKVVAAGRLAVKGGDGRLGSHVFVLKGAHEGAKGLAWQGITHHEATGGAPAAGSSPEGAVLSRFQADATFQRALTQRMHPGMVMVVTDNPLHPDRRSGTDFVIMSS